MKSISIKAFAKVNLGLKILEKRKDGYHNIETIMQTVSLFDQLNISPNDQSIMIMSNNPNLPCDETNLCYRAAKIFLERKCKKGGVSIHIEKNIPIGAGLGGGSSDAASVLLGLELLFSLNVSKKEMESMALAVGSDVPFFTYGGIAFVSGRGEKVEPIQREPFFNYLIVFPGFSVDTKCAYEQIKFLTKSENYIRVLSYNFNAGCTVDIGKLLANDFEEVMLREYPELKMIRQLLIQNGAASVSLSGSGSSVYGIFYDKKTTDSALAHLTKKGYWVRKAFSIKSSEIPKFTFKE